MKEILNELFNYKTLTKDEAKAVLTNIAQQKYSHIQIASFLTVFAMRGVTIDEMSGFVEALQEGCIKVDLDGYDTIDMCGTGGDGKDTFNISTISSFVVAGAGIKVAKHGNYGVSSGCGSSNLLETLGYTFTNDSAKLKNDLEKHGMCYMHAPLFHPPMKEVAPVRKGMQVRTFFNMAGPLVNPAFPKAQAVGVFDLDVARVYKYVLQQTNKNFIIIHGTDGYDEISLTAPVKLMANDFERIMTPEDFGFKTIQPREISGGSNIDDAVKMCLSILENKATAAQKNVILANSAMGIKSLRANLPIEECISMAKESLESEKALKVMNGLCKR